MDRLGPSFIYNKFMGLKIERIVATDCGSTTTKAILIEKNRQEEYRLAARGEAPTTVEKPFEDVTIGVLNAFRDLEEQTMVEVPKNFKQGKRALIKDEKICRFWKEGEPFTPQPKTLEGSDIYVSTSSAAGGLQMIVAGVVKSMSAESAERAALGAGAIIMDTLAVDDGRKDYERVSLLRELKPDIILLAGGTDGGTKAHILEMAETLKRANPKPRFGQIKLPIIYAGNKEAQSEIQTIFKDCFELRIVENIRPVIDQENLVPARNQIHELFLEHVMQHAPGYHKLADWASTKIMATPNAVGQMIQNYAKQKNINVIGVDIGGATTDVFSVFSGIYNRTVSANLGMSYSVGNVLKEAGTQNIARWLPFSMEINALRNRLRNKMIRPTTLPQTYKDLLIEHAVSREALRLSLTHHQSLARTLLGQIQSKELSRMFEQAAGGETLIQKIDLHMLIGSGGVLSHAPKRAQAMLMLVDAFEVEGITTIALDSIFMMPHLGVLSQNFEEIATEVFEKDCLLICGDCVAPVGTTKQGDPCLEISSSTYHQTIPFGKLELIPLQEGETLFATLTPTKNFNLGAGKGKPVQAKLKGGVVGVLIDTRGRPLIHPNKPEEQIQQQRENLLAFSLDIPS